MIDYWSLLFRGPNLLVDNKHETLNPAQLSITSAWTKPPHCDPNPPFGGVLLVIYPLPRKSLSARARARAEPRDRASDRRQNLIVDELVHIQVTHNGSKASHTHNPRKPVYDAHGDSNFHVPTSPIGGDSWRSLHLRALCSGVPLDK